MSTRFPAQAKGISVEGLAGATRVRFAGEIPHGKHTRQVAMDLHPELIVKIAAALIATKDCACDGEWQRRRRHHSELGWQPGHAIWHVENPDMPMPCVDHSKVIDMDALPSTAAQPRALPECPRCQQHFSGDHLCAANHDDDCEIRTSRDGWDADCSCSLGRP